MATHPLGPRPPALRRRLHARWLAGGASVVVLAMLGACAGGAPPGPLVVGGQLAAGLATLEASEPLSADLWLVPTLGPLGLPDPAPAAPRPELRPAPRAPLPSPRKPTLEPRVVWLPQLKPTPQAALAAASFPPTVWPAPPKPDGPPVIEPAAGPPEPAPVAIAQGPAEWPRRSASVTAAASAPTVWPAPPKPDGLAVVEPAAGPPEPAPVAIARGPTEGPRRSASVTAAASTPTVWPAPPKPDGLAVIEPPAGPPETAPIVIARGLTEWPRRDASVTVAEPDALLPQLDRAAREALLAGDASTALQLYERTSELFPAARSALLGRALALQQLGRQGEAQALYQVLLEEDASDLGARIALIGVLAERAPDEALRLLRRLARYHPDDARLPAQIAMTLARQGALDAAIAEQRRAVVLAPANLGHQINLAVLHDRAGHSGEAVQAYSGALELATLTGAPSAQLGQIAARLQHLRALQQPRQVPAQAPR